MSAVMIQKTKLYEDTFTEKGIVYEVEGELFVRNYFCYDSLRSKPICGWEQGENDPSGSWLVLLYLAVYNGQKAWFITWDWYPAYGYNAGAYREQILTWEEGLEYWDEHMS